MGTVTLKSMRSLPSDGDSGAVEPGSGVWDAFFAGDRRACARIISLVENNPDFVPGVRDRLAGRLGSAIRIGFTGPPGVGKSTLTSAVTSGLVDKGRHVGIVAVDPSSPFSGGAFLGDRIRMEQLVGDPRVFVRSMASRSGRGGLSPATPYVADVIEGFGMDRVLIETVGVGQAELDVLACVDLVVLVLQPATGDAIQSMKAGIIEAADLIVINKADLPGLETMKQSLQFALSLSGTGSEKSPPILSTSAVTSEGIDALVSELESQAVSLTESGRHRQLRQARAARDIRDAISEELWRQLRSVDDVDVQIEQAAERLADSGGSPYEFVRELAARLSLSISPAATLNHP